MLGCVLLHPSRGVSVGFGYDSLRSPAIPEIFVKFKLGSTYSMVVLVTRLSVARCWDSIARQRPAVTCYCYAFTLLPGDDVPNEKSENPV